MDFNLYKEHYSSTYHVALCSVFKGLDNFQPLFESHLFDQICSDTSKFLKWKLKKKKREKKDSWCTMYSFPLMFRNSILWRITAKMLSMEVYLYYSYTLTCYCNKATTVSSLCCPCCTQLPDECSSHYMSFFFSSHSDLLWNYWVF